jgi:dTDP-4-dehydrorhamnose reductase
MRLLVIGQGLLGKEIVNQTKWDYISRKEHNFDFSDINTYLNYLDEYDTIINCVAHTQTYDKDKNNSKKINYEAVVNLSDYCSSKNKKLIHISTDYVYANSIANSSEEDLPLISENWYTYYKLLADEYILLKNENFLICRCSFKDYPFEFEKAWIGQIGNFDYVNVITELIIKLIKNDAKGLYNVGTEIKSIYGLACQTKLDVIQALKPDYVPKNTTMNLDKLNNFLKKI